MFDPRNYFDLDGKSLKLSIYNFYEEMFKKNFTKYIKCAVKEKMKLLLGYFVN